MALLAGYSHEGWYDEVFASDGSIRPHYRSITSWLEELAPDALVQRARTRDAAFRTQGITFSISGDDEGLERTFPLDLVPRIIQFSDWRRIEQGLVQRISALNQFLEDIYTGEGAIVRDGILPAWLVKTSRGFVRQAVGVSVLTELAASWQASTSSGTPRGPSWCSRTTFGCRAGSPTSSRTGWR